MNIRRIIISVAASVTAALVLACGSTGDGDTATKATAAAGASGSVVGGAVDNGAPKGALRLKVAEHATVSFADGSTGDVVVNSIKAQGTKAQETFLVVNVTMLCTAGKISYNPFYWSMTAGDGTKLDMGIGGGVANQMHSGELSAQQKITGNLVFEGVVAQAAKAELTLSSPLGAALAYWVNG